jgi:hypothetical protein
MPLLLLLLGLEVVDRRYHGRHYRHHGRVAVAILQLRQQCEELPQARVMLGLHHIAAVHMIDRSIDISLCL